MHYIREHGGAPLDAEHATINQPLGVERAIEMGFKRIAVTVIGPRARDIPKIRRIERRYENVKVAVFSTCNTLVEERDLRCLEQADVVQKFGPLIPSAIDI